MKILLTGASGFIGSYVLNELLQRGHEVIAATIDKENIAYHGVTYKYFSLDEMEEDKNYFEFFDKPDKLIHLAWQGLPNYKALFHFEKNLPVHYSFIKNLVSNGLKDVSVAGTCFEYGMKDGLLSEEMCSDPQNPYALAKDTLRKFLQELQKHMPFELKWIRMFYMYGKGQSPNSILSQLEKALQNADESFNMSGGEQLRDYLQVEEVAANIASIALQDKITGIINNCSGVPMSIKELVEDHLKKTNRSIKLNLGFYPYTDYEPMAFWGDPSKLKTILSQ